MGKQTGTLVKIMQIRKRAALCVQVEAYRGNAGAEAALQRPCTHPGPVFCSSAIRVGLLQEAKILLDCVRAGELFREGGGSSKGTERQKDPTVQEQKGVHDLGRDDFNRRLQRIGRGWKAWTLSCGWEPLRDLAAS